MEAREGPTNRPSEGWPLGLKLLGFRMRVLETLRLSEGNDFNSFKTASFTSESSSEFDTNVQSGSSNFFREKPITLGDILGLSTNLSARTTTNSFAYVESSGDLINARNGKEWWNLVTSADGKTNSKTANGWWSSINCACAKAYSKRCNFAVIGAQTVLEEVVQVDKFVKFNEEEKVYFNLGFEDALWSFSDENPLFCSDESLAFASEDFIDLLEPPSNNDHESREQ